MDRDELIENLRTTLQRETVCAHIESRNEADVRLQWMTNKLLRINRMFSYCPFDLEKFRRIAIYMW